ncbi:MAG TPA: hypothetical protein VN175_06455, partial [Rhizomicrobium sp.]|nr:hypothetical protein [Rhizomicrobium sp.]
MRTSPLRLLAYGLVVATGLLFALPNLLTKEQTGRLPSFLPSRQVALGLDLRGGSHLVLEVDSTALVRERLQELANDAKDELRRAKIAYSDIGQSASHVDIQLADAAQRSAAVRALRRALTSGQDLETPRIRLETPAAAQIRITMNESGIRDSVNAATEQSLEIVRRRIDQIGVSEPTIQRVGTDRILVQLPGVQDPGHIRTLLGSTAKLSFHMLSDSKIGSPP